MICIAVLEPDVKRQKILRDWLVRFTVQRNCELELLRFTDENPIAKLQAYTKQIQIALISLDNEHGEEIGKYLYEQNQDCRICYYREKPCALEALLLTRPIGFYLWHGAQERFLQKFNEIYEEVLFAQATFRYETKSRMYLLPKQNILYFQSDLRYVNICLIHGDNPRVPAKLSEVEQFVGDGFVRIHKSYLVNSKHVLWMDKKNHIVFLSNGEQLPVSDAQYETACEKLRNAK